VQYRILGPLEVLRDGESLDLGPHKQRSLLALLLLHANRVVSTDRILEDLWGEDAEGKENSLWVYVSRLRGVLEPDRDKATHPQLLVTRAHGYVLNVDPAEIDATQFEREVVRGRSLIREDAEDASQVLHDALGLWRGAALQDFAYDNFAQPDITRLEELRLGGFEDAIDADLRLGRAGELIGELETHHQHHPLRERPVGQLMLALYRAGRSADALRTFERFRRGVGEELGIDPSPELSRLEEQVLLHDSRLQVRRTARTRTDVAGRRVNPFKGLRPFQEDDAADFFGRDQLVADVVRRLSEEAPLIALVGPSGSGKSSVVRAGLIPALRKGAVEGSDHWLIAHMLPGSDPFIELEAALLRSTLDAPDSLVDILRGDDDSGLVRAALRLLPDDSSRLVVVVDQFEELFTLVEDESTRARFLDQLVGAVDDPYGRVAVLVTLRSDFYSHPLAYSGFATRMGTGVINVVPLTSDELEAAALRPAERSGVTLEPALLAELITDVIGQPGALPMFQYTLTELFDRRVGDTLSVDVYRTMDGVRGALTRRADELYKQLDAGEQAAAQQLLLRLVGVAEHGEWNRRRVHASEIIGLDVDVVAMQRVIESFATHRLLSLDRDQATGAPTVEVAHEALLQEWDQLRAWIEQNRDDLRRHRELAAAASSWHAAGRSQDYVYTGARLAESVEWTATSALKLTTREQAFLDAGLERRSIEEAAEEERRGREQHLEQTARRRTLGMAAAMVILVAVLGAVVWAMTRSPGPKIALVQLSVEAGGGPQELVIDGWEQAEGDFRFQGLREVPLIDAEERIRELADDGYELIITSLFDFGEAAYDVAGDFPQTRFVVFDGRDTSRQNVTSLSFQREGGAYLMGVAAALQSETHHVGFIGGWQSRTTDARRAAYTAGARSVDPDIAVDSVYLGPFHDGQNGPFLDIELAQATARDMYRSGADVIHHSAGTAGTTGIPAAADALTGELGRRLWVIGTEIDERRKVPPEHQDHYLTSMWKRKDKAVYEAIRVFLAGDLEPGLHELGLETGSVDYAPDGGLSSEHVLRLEAVKDEMLAGRLVPSSAATQSPEWTRPATVMATLAFDGVNCASDVAPMDVAGGDVIQVRLENATDVPVRLAFAAVADDVDPNTVWNAADPLRDGLLYNWVETNTAPRATSGVAMRLIPDAYFVYCFTDSGSYEGTAFTAHFETTCEGPDPVSDDPTDVIDALAAALTARDADAVCSLFADDAVLSWSAEWSIEGNADIAQAITPFDDDRWFQQMIFTDIEVAGQVVTWTEEHHGLYSVDTSQGHRAVVENGKIKRVDAGG
jgi:basic membrane lipoprotein Med (substrate-binding protein (PBP1-ABC) superfamily)/DNA-binding SARP family transcriptional activator